MWGSLKQFPQLLPFVLSHPHLKNEQTPTQFKTPGRNSLLPIKTLMGMKWQPKFTDFSFWP